MFNLFKKQPKKKFYGGTIRIAHMPNGKYALQKKAEYGYFHDFKWGYLRLFNEEEEVWSGLDRTELTVFAPIVYFDTLEEARAKVFEIEAEEEQGISKR